MHKLLTVATVCLFVSLRRAVARHDLHRRSGDPAVLTIAKES